MVCACADRDRDAYVCTYRQFLASCLLHGHILIELAQSFHGAWFDVHNQRAELACPKHLDSLVIGECGKEGGGRKGQEGGGGRGIDM